MRLSRRRLNFHLWDNASFEERRNLYSRLLVRHTFISCSFIVLLLSIIKNVLPLIWTLIKFDKEPALNTFLCPCLLLPATFIKWCRAATVFLCDSDVLPQVNLNKKWFRWHRFYVCQISRFLLLRYWNQYRGEITVGSVHLYFGTHGMISDIKQYNFFLFHRRIRPFRCLFSSHMKPTCCTWLTHSMYRTPCSVLASLSSQNQETVKYPAFVFCDSVGSKGQFETACWPSDL